tara:strand:+ start:33 stop:386 length:354 start_codon:yes stop_codon:yes gene_type:complete
MKPFNNLSNTNFAANRNYSVAFNRRELNSILRVYGRMVASGEWRDYGISILKDVSIFSIYRHASECPIILIEKNPKLTKKQGIYSIIAMDGRILKRGNDLDRVLNLFGPKLMRIVKS